MTLILREIVPADEYAFRKMLDDWDNSPDFNMLYGLMSEMLWSSILDIHVAQKNESQATSSAVPVTSLYAFVGDEIVGKVSVRHRLNEKLLLNGGHIGYGVLSAHRGKGYASKMLGHALDYCRTLDLPQVLLTCAESNTSSIKVIEKHGGVLDISTDPTKRRYWITFQSSL